MYRELLTPRAVKRVRIDSTAAGLEASFFNQLNLRDESQPAAATKTPERVGEITKDQDSKFVPPRGIYRRLKEYILRRFVLPQLSPLQISLNADNCTSLQAILQECDLGFHQLTVGPREWYDLPGSAVIPLLRTLTDFCPPLGQKPYVSALGRLIPVSYITTLGLGLDLEKRGTFNLVICDNQDRVVAVHEIRTWRIKDDHWYTVDPSAPIKRVLKNVPPTAPIRTDAVWDFPVDAVFTWVNAADARWRELVRPYKAVEPVDLDQYGQNDELRFSLRALTMNAPWIRTVYIFSNCAPPNWFEESDRYRWVDHTDVIEQEQLPLFSSHAIETYLHRMPELSEHFLYLNDDMMITAPVRKSDFFMPTGMTVANLERYGTVLFHCQCATNGTAKDYQFAAVNGAALINDRFGYFPTYLHQHVPYALRKSVLEEIERKFASEIAQTRGKKFRSCTDLSVPSFFYHHFAEATGRAVRRSIDSLILTPRNAHSAGDRCVSRYKFICLNDGDGSYLDPVFKSFKSSFLAERFPLLAPCEMLVSSSRYSSQKRWSEATAK